MKAGFPDSNSKNRKKYWGKTNKSCCKNLLEKSTFANSLMLSRSKYNFILIFAVTDEEKLWMAETAISMNKQIFAQ